MLDDREPGSYLHRPGSLHLAGDGLCAEICPEIFEMHDDGLAYVKEVEWPDIYNGDGNDPVYKMARGLAAVPEPYMESCIEAAEECPRRMYLHRHGRRLTDRNVLHPV